MAAGCLLLGNRDAAPCSGQQNGNVLEDTIDRLKRCLRFASTDDDDEKPTSPSLSSSVAEESPSHDGHMCTDDSPRSDSSASGTTDGVLFHTLTNGNSNNHHAASSNSTNHVSSHSSVIHFDDRYEIDESQIGDIMNMITKDLSEPYSIYTYRYFIHNWPGLCFLATEKSTGINVGAVVCKMDVMDDNRRRGYVAMLVVDKDYRCHGIGTRLVMRALSTMQDAGCDEVVLETEVTNVDAQRLYENLGFIREKRLFRYYLNGVDAFRLKLFFTPPPRKLRSPLL